VDWKWSSGARVEADNPTEVFKDNNKLDCAFCCGKGEKPRGSRCSVCGGTGKVSVQPPYIRCAYCKGTGEEKPRSNLTCIVFKGKDYVNVKQTLENCPKCGGRGSDPHNKIPCIMCRGKDVVTVKRR